MPGPVFGVIDDDTLLNTRKALFNSGIKKIYAYQTSSETLKTHDSKTTVLNESGKVESISACFLKNKDNKETWCVFDTFLYDDRGRIKETKFRDLSLIKIVHAPSNPMVKGTPLVRAAIKKIAT